MRTSMLRALVLALGTTSCNWLERPKGDDAGMTVTTTSATTLPTAAPTQVASAPPHSSTTAPMSSVPLPPASSTIGIALGGNGTCVVRAGKVTCWGSGSGNQRSTPTQIAGVDDAVAVAVGRNDACALLTGGSVKCWGKNEHGELGDGTRNVSWAPVAVKGVTGAKAIAVGDSYACVVTQAGGVSCWGDNSTGQLGTCDGQASLSPVKAKDGAAPIANATAVYAATTHTCAIVADAGSSSLVCWGPPAYRSDSVIQTFAASDPCPRKMGAASAATIGNAHACSLSNGDVLCWGVNDKSQVGGPEPYYRDPFKVLSDAVGVSVGLQYSCAITKAGRVQCWGDDYHGTLGDGADAGVTPSQSKPVVGLRDVVALASGINHSCAVTSTQRVFCWGDAGNGQMGDGRHASFNGPLMPQTTPVEVPGPF